MQALRGKAVYNVLSCFIIYRCRVALNLVVDSTVSTFVIHIQKGSLRNTSDFSAWRKSEGDSDFHLTIGAFWFPSLLIANSKKL